MSKYLKEYRLSDLRAMLRNSRTLHHRTAASLVGKTAVIAGATSGVGLAAARELRRFGCDVILIARNEKKARRVGAELNEIPSTCFNASYRPVRYYRADFADIEQVRAVTHQIVQREPKIDVLINSAGIHSTTKHYTRDGLELVFCVNHLAAFVLTHRLIPLMKQSPEARIIQVNSQGHRFNGLDVGDLNWHRRRYTGLRGYGASKTAQLLTVWEFARRLRGTSVTINAMHPGEVKSGIGSNNGRLYKWFKATFLWRTLKDPKISGEALHYLVADSAVAQVSGEYFNLTHPEKPAPHALDGDVGRMVWQKTLQMTGLDDEL